MLGGTRVLLYPIFHPAAALYTPRMLDVLQADFERLPELLGRESRAAAAGRGGPPSPRPSRPPSSSGSSDGPNPVGAYRARVLELGSPSRRGDRGDRGAARRAARAGRRRRRRRASSAPGKTTFVRGACRALGVDSAGHEPDVHDRPPLRGARSGRPPRPLPPRRHRRRRIGAISSRTSMARFASSSGPSTRAAGCRRCEPR